MKYADSVCGSVIKRSPFTNYSNNTTTKAALSKMAFRRLNCPLLKAALRLCETGRQLYIINNDNFALIFLLSCHIKNEIYYAII